MAVAENTADELARSDGREVQLEEDPDLQLPFLLPEDGYSCDVVRNIPNGLQEFLDPLCQRGGWRCPHLASELARMQASLALVCRCVSTHPRCVRPVCWKSWGSSGLEGSVPWGRGVRGVQTHWGPGCCPGRHELAWCQVTAGGTLAPPPSWVLCEPGSSICPVSANRKCWCPQSRAGKNSTSVRTRRPEL